MATLQEIIALRNQTNQPLQQLGSAVADMYSTYKRNERQDQGEANKLQAIGLLKQSSEAQTPEEAESLFMQAYSIAPELIQGFTSAQKARREAMGGSDPLTEYQKEKLDLDRKSQQLRELEINASMESNENKRKSLENRLTKERIQIEKMQMEAAANNKGTEAQKLLRDASEGAKKASSFARRMIDSGQSLNELESQIDPTARVIGIISGGDGITSEIANKIASPEEQAYATAASDFVTAQLRQESGAAIGADEFERKYREFFPVVGDTDKQIELKRKRRDKASQDMRNLSGGLYDALYIEDQEPEKDNADQSSMEGRTATNPNTGETLIYRGGKWQKQ